MVGWWVKIFEIKRGAHFFIYTTELFIFVVAIFRGHTQIFQYQRFIFKIKIFINRTFSKSMNFFKIKDQSFNFLFLLFLFFRFRRRHFYQKPRKNQNQPRDHDHTFLSFIVAHFHQKSTQEKPKIVVTKNQNQLLLYKSSRQPHPLFTL